MAITALPPPPDRASPSTFAAKGDALLSALPTFVTEANALQADVNAKQVSAATQVTLATTQANNAAASATAAAASSTATIWVSGTTYAIGNVRFSPINFQNYRRKTAGAGTTDPSLDTTNWSILATIPTVIGDAGKFLSSDGSLISFQALPDPNGSGGTTITGSVTLTVSSAASMTVTPSNAGLYATLPNATTCSKGSILFSIYNNGDYDYGIKNSAGIQLGWVLPRTNSIVGLSDNSTAAGIWNISNLCKLGVTAKKDLPLPMYLGTIKQQPIFLDSNRTLITFNNNNTGLLYGIIYDSSTLTWGSSTLIRNANVAEAQLLLIATNKVLVNSYIAGSTALETVVLSTSGTTITVNTAVATTLVGPFSGSYLLFSNMISVGTSYIFAYRRATSITGVRAITVSGTVPTVGAEVINSQDSTVIQLFASGSIARVTTSGTVFSCQPYTVSGSTLTAGTAATTAVTSSLSRTFQNSSGNIIAIFPNTTLTAAIFKLTGTTEAVSVISMGANNPTTFDAYYISATKTGVVWGSQSGIYNANILVDTSGTASVGTPVTGLITINTNAAAYLVDAATLNTTTSNVMKALFNTTNGGVIALIDCSGTSPTIISNTSIPSRNCTIPTSDGSSLRGTIDKRSLKQIVAGDTTICLNSSTYSTNGCMFTKNGFLLNFTSNFLAGTSYASGINANQSWCYEGVAGSLILVDGAEA